MNAQKISEFAEASVLLLAACVGCDRAVSIAPEGAIVRGGTQNRNLRRLPGLGFEGLAQVNGRKS